MTEQIADIIDRARELIETKGWCQEELAFDADGRSVMPNDNFACRFCLEGAVKALKVSSKDEDATFETLRKILNFDALWVWNDDPARTKEDVVAALKSAAELARTND